MLSIGKKAKTASEKAEAMQVIAKSLDEFNRKLDELCNGDIPDSIGYDVTKLIQELTAELKEKTSHKS